MLVDTLPVATSALGTAFKSAKAAANSWGQADVVASISLLEVPFAASKATMNVEQWQMNKAVHYNAWADLEKGDFLPVVTALRACKEHFSCTTSAEMLSIEPVRARKLVVQGTRVSVRVKHGGARIIKIKNHNKK